MTKPLRKPMAAAAYGLTSSTRSKKKKVDRSIANATPEVIAYRTNSKSVFFIEAHQSRGVGYVALPGVPSLFEGFAGIQPVGHFAVGVAQFRNVPGPQGLQRQVERNDDIAERV